MKKIILVLLLLPLFSFAQLEKSLQLKIGILQNFVNQGADGEQAFWQTKGKITFAIVNYTDEQNPVFKELFINQYREIIPVFKIMVETQDEKASTAFVKIIIRQEEDYRNLLTKEQLELYRNKLTEFELNNIEAKESYSSLFFSDALLKEYKSKF